MTGVRRPGIGSGSARAFAQPLALDGLAPGGTSAGSRTRPTADPGTGLSRRRALAAAGMLCTCPGLPLAQPGAAAPLREAPLRVALVPYLSPRAMLGQFEPLRVHLESALGRAVEFHTAPSFAALIEGVRRREQPFTLLPMHLARIAVADWGATLVVRSTRESPVQLLTPRSLGLTRPEALRGHTVAAIDPLSITALMLRRWLRERGLDGSVRVLHLPSANAAAKALALGEVQAMSVAQGQALDIPWVRPDALEVLGHLGQVLTPCFVAHPEVPAAEVLAFRRAVLDFSAPASMRGASGAAFVEPGARDLEPYEPFAEQARRMLDESARRR